MALDSSSASLSSFKSSIVIVNGRRPTGAGEEEVGGRGGHGGIGGKGGRKGKERKRQGRKERAGARREDNQGIDGG